MLHQFFFCLCCSLSHHLFVLSIFNGVFSWCIVHLPVRHKSNIFYSVYRSSISAPTWSAFIYQQPSHVHDKTRTINRFVDCDRACGFSTLNRSFNPSTSSTYAVSLRTRELIVLAISCLFFSSYLPAVIYKCIIFPCERSDAGEYGFCTYGRIGQSEEGWFEVGHTSVSYTHLTLPTKA